MQVLRSLEALLTRESREQRWLLLTLAVAGCLFMAAFHSADLVWNPYAWTIDKHGPALVYALIAAGLLITESLTRDSECEVGERIESLPAGPLALVSAKLLWLAAAVVALGSVVHVAEATWLSFAGSGLDGLYRSRVAGQSFPLEVYGPIWIGWAVALGLLCRRWLMAALALVACAGASIHVWPWPLKQTAVLPGWAVGAATCAVPALLAWRFFRPGWLLPREGIRTRSQAAGMAAIVFGVIGVTQVQGRAAVEWPRPAAARLAPASLSPDGQTLSLLASGSFPQLGGRQGWRRHIWDVDTETGTLTRDQWTNGAHPFDYRDRRIPRTLDGTLSNRNWRVWWIDPWARIELGLEPWDRDNPAGYLGRVQATEAGTLSVSIPTRQVDAVIPWRGKAYVGAETGIVYSLNERVLRRHDLLASTERILAELPAPATPREWTLEVCPYGGVLRLRIYREQTRYLDAKDGSLLAAMEPEWLDLWTGGPAPFAVARRFRHTPNHGPERINSLESLWLSRDGAKHVVLPMEGSVISSASGRIFLVGEEGIVELNADGRVLRPLEILSRNEPKILP